MAKSWKSLLSKERQETDKEGASASKNFTPDRSVRPSFTTLVWRSFVGHSMVSRWAIMTLIGIIIAFGILDYFCGSTTGTWLPPMALAFFFILIFYLTRVLAIDTVRSEDIALTRSDVSPLLFFTSRLSAMMLSLTVVALFLAAGVLWDWHLKSESPLLLLIDRVPSPMSLLFILFFPLVSAIWAGTFFRGRIFPTMIISFAGIATLYLFRNLLTVCLFPFMPENNKDYHSYFGVLLSIGIVTLSILAASYYRVRSILSERTGRRQTAVNLAILFGPTLIFFIVFVPFLRIATVSLPPATQEIHTELAAASFPADEITNAYDALIKRCHIHEDRICRAESFKPMIEAWNDTVSDWGNDRPARFSFCALSLRDEMIIYSRTNRLAGELSPEELRRGIRFLETIPETRVPLRRQGIELAKDKYVMLQARIPHSFPTAFFPTKSFLRRLFERYCYKKHFYREIVPLSVWPWENVLTERLLLRRTADFIESAEYIEKTLYREEETYTSSRIDDVLSFVSEKQLFGCNIWDCNDYIFQWGNESATPYMTEVGRRMALAELAILLYYREKGDWPDSFAAVVEAGYLASIPTVPGTMGKEEIQLTARSEKKEGKYFIPLSAKEMQPEMPYAMLKPRKIFYSSNEVAYDSVDGRVCIVSPTPILWYTVGQESENHQKEFRSADDLSFSGVPSPKELPLKESTPERDSSNETKEIEL